MRALRCIALLVAGLAFGACGGGDGSQRNPKAFAADACAASRKWVAALRSESRELQKLGRDSSLRQRKEAIQRLLSKAVFETRKLGRELASIGTPDADGGKELAVALKGAARASTRTLLRARARADRLSTVDARRFAAQARALGDSTRDSLSQPYEAVGQPRSAELREAFRDSPGCRGLRTM